MKRMTRMAVLLSLPALLVHRVGGGIAVVVGLVLLFV